jgi:hypothetical protein
MKFEEFKGMTDLMVKHWKAVDTCYNIGIDIHDLLDAQDMLVNTLWGHILTEEGVDWFNWFMYEKNYIHDGVGRADLTASADGEPICENLEGLYNYLTGNNYFKV